MRDANLLNPHRRNVIVRLHALAQIPSHAQLYEIYYKSTRNLFYRRFLVVLGFIYLSSNALYINCF